MRYSSDTFSYDTEEAKDIDSNQYLSFNYQSGTYITEAYEVTRYDLDAKILYREGFDEDGNLVSKELPLYDDSGERLGTETTTYNPDGSHSVSARDEVYNNLYKKDYDSTGKLVTSTEYRYDVDGSDLGYVQEEYKEDGSRIQTEVDENYHTTGSRTYDSSGALISEVEYRYDENGKQTRTILTTYYYDGSYTIIEKDGSGKVLSEKTYDADGNRINP